MLVVGSYAIAGWIGSVVFFVISVAEGVGVPVTGSGGDKTFDHSGRNTLYGGMSAQFCVLGIGAMSNPNFQ